jgi:hypothetical protein
MRELGGPTARARLPDVHGRRVADPWWFKIVERTGAAVGTIGVWETSHGGEVLHETGWMVLPAFQRRGVASQAWSGTADAAVRGARGARGVERQP